jgi:hypothetical protein
MNTPTVIVGGRSGCVFEGEVPETYCFVPGDCISGEGGDVHVAEIDYMRSGWDVRNMRFNDAAFGEHLFPDAHRPVSDLNSAPVRIFLNRIKTVRSA